MVQSPKRLKLETIAQGLDYYIIAFVLWISGLIHWSGDLFTAIKAIWDMFLEGLGIKT